MLCVSLLVACVPAVPTTLASEYFSIEFADAANLRSQLAYGTILLDGTAITVSAEQAKTLIPLWQVVISMSGDTTTASEELTASKKRSNTCKGLGNNSLPEM